MSTARAPAPATRAPNPTSTADNATAPSTPEASRPGSAEAAPPHPALAQRRPGPVDWPAHLARLDELRSETGALPRGALAALADELGVKVGTVYSQMSRHRRDEALREQGRAAALTQHTDPTCSDPAAPGLAEPGLIHSGSPSPALTPAAAHRVELRCPGCAALLTLAVIDPQRPSHLAEPGLIHSGSPSPDQALTPNPHAADPTPELRQGKTSP